MQTYFATRYNRRMKAVPAVLGEQIQIATEWPDSVVSANWTSDHVEFAQPEISGRVSSVFVTADLIGTFRVRNEAVLAGETLYQDFELHVQKSLSRIEVSDLFLMEQVIVL